DPEFSDYPAGGGHPGTGRRGPGGLDQLPAAVAGHQPQRTGPAGLAEAGPRRGGGRVDATTVRGRVRAAKADGLVRAKAEGGRVRGCRASRPGLGLPGSGPILSPPWPHERSRSGPRRSDLLGERTVPESTGPRPLAQVAVFDSPCPSPRPACRPSACLPARVSGGTGAFPVGRRGGRPASRVNAAPRNSPVLTTPAGPGGREVGHNS